MSIIGICVSGGICNMYWKNTISTIKGETIDSYTGLLNNLCGKQANKTVESYTNP